MREMIPSEQERPWVADAACIGFEMMIFFPGADGDAQPALRICENCPVRLQCLEYALESRQRYGVWGGATERQRRSMLRRSA